MQTRLSRRRMSLSTRECAALILAGGKGSRLAPLTDRRCKPAVPFGGKYRIIDFTLSNCMNSGIRTVGVITQYLPYELIEHCRLTWGWTRGVFGDAVTVLPACKGASGEGWYLGTADAVYQNLPLIRSYPVKYLLVLSGDHIYKMDYGEMLSAHIDTGADISVGALNVPVRDASRFGVLQTCDSGRVYHFQEKPETPVPDPLNPTQALASMGIYIFSRDLLMDLLEQDHANPASRHDFGMDIFPRACQHLHVQSFRFESLDTDVQKYWRDVGTLDSFFDANMDLVAISPDLDLYDQNWPIWTYNEPAPGAKFVFNDRSNGIGLALNSVISAGSVVTGQIARSIMFNYGRIKKHALVEDSLLLPHVTVGRNCVIQRAIIDDDTYIPDGMQIGTDPEADRQRFLVTEGGRVIVTRDMIRQL